jgi:hypothetical protein
VEALKKLTSDDQLRELGKLSGASTKLAIFVGLAGLQFGRRKYC